MNETATRTQRWRVCAIAASVVLVGVGIWSLTRAPTSAADERRELLTVEREHLFEEMERELQLWPEQTSAVRAVFSDSEVLSQGNPRLSVHPMTREECRRRRSEQEGGLPAPSPRCKKPNMVVAFDPGGEQRPETATLCVDQYEFPNIPCAYPVVHVTALEAALLCQAVGKRLCDAHEWEGACAGAVRAPEQEYVFGIPRSVATRRHNSKRERVWAYGAAQSPATCATGSEKTPGCGGGFTRCGSNTYPAGAFPGCVSPFGVYDQHGNVAEHMNLPTRPEELGGKGGLGRTEMKGSWFIWGTDQPYEDDCRWRAKDWHPSRVRAPRSHRNYHLGFRCCLDLPPTKEAQVAESPSYSDTASAASAQQRKPVE